ncbi:MAG: membrane protein insertase YidC [Erysipelotrichaceae bacterium]|nr:membrane protein insertase YidC [Erysipelotrichaceae bacterium]MCI9524370.1 membrane protein insertase YidC [Erysipelotrichaceae bacterium]
MTHFFKDKKKMLFMGLLIMVTLVACTNPRDPETGQIIEKYLIRSTTPIGDQLSLGWFDGLIVWPIAQLINWISKYTDAGIGIIIVTLLLQAFTFIFSIKSQVSAQKMQMIQPELQKIQAKYQGKSDDRSRMMQAQEMQALYSKNKINPFGTLLVTFLQFPIILGVYQATMRAEAVVSGTFMGISLTQTPIWGLNNGQMIYMVIFVLMVIAQFMSMKFPQWLQKYRQKQNNVKQKNYLKQNQPKNGMANSMNMMMYVSLAMISILAVNWPLSMSFYWLVSSVTRIIQNLVINQFFMKNE